MNLKKHIFSPFFFVFANRRDADDEVEHQYIKKPPNAFMVFARKHRKALMGKLDKKDSASVNVILGEMVSVPLIGEYTQATTLGPLQLNKTKRSNTGANHLTSKYINSLPQ